MHKFSLFVINHRKLLIGLTVLITLALGLSLRNLTVNPDITSYFPETDPVIQLFNYLGKEYGGNTLAMVALETEDVFNSRTIETIHELTSRFRLTPGVSYVTSLTNVLDIREDEFGFEIGRLVDEYNLPRTPEELAALKEYVLGKEMFRNRLVSEDAGATLIICRLRHEADQVETARQLKAIVREVDPVEKVYYGGFPFMMLDIHNLITQDLIFLIPLVSFLIIFFLYLSFRSLQGVLLPLLAVMISVIWTLGVMTLLKIPLTIISNVIPVILIAVGSAYSIHVLSRFNEETAKGKSGRENLAAALHEVGLPVFLAALTTIAGFLSFIFGSYLIMIREFGIFAALGVLFTLILSVTFVPAILALITAKNNRPRETGEKKWRITAALVGGIEKLVMHRPKTVLLTVTLLFILGVAGIPRIDRKVDLIEYFKPHTSIRQAEEFLQKKFGGSGLIQIFVEGDIQDPAVLREMKKMEEFLLAQGDVHNPQSVVGLLEELNYVMGEGRTLPDTRSKVSNLWFLLEGEEIMSQMVNPGRTEAVIQATVEGGLKTTRVHELVTALDEYIAGVDPRLVAFRQTGMPSIHRNLDVSIINSQLQSLILAIVLVFIVMIFLVGSFAGGLIGLLPIVFTLVLIFGFMGFAGIPLDIATVLVAGVSIGIGIDYSIHFLGRYRREVEKGQPLNEAVRKTLHTTGQAILTNLITVACGFFVLIFCELVPLQRFGVLVAVTMLSSGFGALILLPAVLLATGARLNTRLLQSKAVKNS